MSASSFAGGLYENAWKPTRLVDEAARTAGHGALEIRGRSRLADYYPTTTLLSLYGWPGCQFPAAGSPPCSIRFLRSEAASDLFVDVHVAPLLSYPPAVHVRRTRRLPALALFALLRLGEVIAGRRDRSPLYPLPL
jgi:hypothetical protein